MGDADYSRYDLEDEFGGDLDDIAFEIAYLRSKLRSLEKSIDEDFLRHELKRFKLLYEEEHNKSFSVQIESLVLQKVIWNLATQLASTGSFLTSDDPAIYVEQADAEVRLDIEKNGYKYV